MISFKFGCKTWYRWYAYFSFSFFIVLWNDKKKYRLTLNTEQRAFAKMLPLYYMLFAFSSSFFSSSFPYSITQAYYLIASLLYLHMLTHSQLHAPFTLSNDLRTLWFQCKLIGNKNWILEHLCWNLLNIKSTQFNRTSSRLNGENYYIKSNMLSSLTIISLWCYVRASEKISKN